MKKFNLSSCEQTQNFLHIHNQLGVKAIQNIQTQLSVIQLPQGQVPISVNDEEYHNSYVCSPYTAYISYAKDELGLIQSPLQRRLLRSGISLGSGLLKMAKINQTASLNNWLFSTNLIPDWTENSLQDIKQQLIEQHPNHAISIRSINTQHHAELINTLQQQGWILIPARQVYLFDEQDPNKWWKRNHSKKDQSLLRKVEAGKLPLTWVKPEDLKDEDFIQIETCFKQLFIEKHSQYNPQFSAEYLQALHEKQLVEFHSFRNDAGRIVASIGLFTQHNIITTPIVGYDTDQPKELGLYRLLMAVLLRLTYERKQPMNLSSGAGHFKRSRGGDPTLEYTAFYINHLSKKRQWAHKVFANIMNKYAPKMFAENEI